jgi:integrase
MAPRVVPTLDGLARAHGAHRLRLQHPGLEPVNHQLPAGGAAGLIFPAARGDQLSDMTLSATIRRMEVAAVPHGFRSTFRDRVSERTNYPNEMAEMAPAHAIDNQSEAAYRRGDMLERQAAMLDDWAKFLATVDSSGVVVPLRKA